jgi:Domain of unknown function (DUF4258)
MKFEVSNHARMRMRRRDIDERMIEAVLEEPEWSPPTSRGTRYDRVVDGRRLCVVIDERRDPIVVVSTWWFGTEDDE